MKWFNTNVGSFDTALQQRPKVLNPVGVDRAVNVILRMANKRVLKSFTSESVICTVLIGIDTRSWRDNFTDDVTRFILPRFWNHASMNLTCLSICSAFKQTRKQQSFQRLRCGHTTWLLL